MIFIIAIVAIVIVAVVFALRRAVTMGIAFPVHLCPVGLLLASTIALVALDKSDVDHDTWNGVFPLSVMIVSSMVCFLQVAVFVIVSLIGGLLRGAAFVIAMVFNSCVGVAYAVWRNYNKAEAMKEPTTLPLQENDEPSEAVVGAADIVADDDDAVEVEDPDKTQIPLAPTVLPLTADQKQWLCLQLVVAASFVEIGYFGEWQRKRRSPPKPAPVTMAKWNEHYGSSSNEHIANRKPNRKGQTQRFVTTTKVGFYDLTDQERHDKNEHRKEMYGRVDTNYDERELEPWYIEKRRKEAKAKQLRELKEAKEAKEKRLKACQQAPKMAKRIRSVVDKKQLVGFNLNKEELDGLKACPPAPKLVKRIRSVADKKQLVGFNFKGELDGLKACPPAPKLVKRIRSVADKKQLVGFNLMEELDGQQKLKRACDTDNYDQPSAKRRRTDERPSAPEWIDMTSVTVDDDEIDRKSSRRLKKSKQQMVLPGQFTTLPIFRAPKKPSRTASSYKLMIEPRVLSFEEADDATLCLRAPKKPRRTASSYKLMIEPRVLSFEEADDATPCLENGTDNDNDINDNNHHAEEGDFPLAAPDDNNPDDEDHFYNDNNNNDAAAAAPVRPKRAHKKPDRYSDNWRQKTSSKKSRKPAPKKSKPDQSEEMKEVPLELTRRSKRTKKQIKRFDPSPQP